MKMKTLSIACVAALGAVSGPVLAWGPALLPNTLEVTMSGASAQLLTLDTLAAGMFEVANLDVYYNAVGGGSYRAYYGTIKPGLGLPVGQKVLLRYRAAGGSVWGVNPVARADLIDHMNLATCGARVATVPNFLCPGVALRRSDAGVSDVEPSMFVGVNVSEADVIAGNGELTVGERGRLTVSPENTVVFGVAASKQLADGLLTNLTRAQVTSMLTGNPPYTAWDAVSTNANLAGKPVVVCRRVNGSGSQATFNNYFGGFPCSSGAVLPADRTASADYAGPGINYTANGFTVIENSTSSLVKACLNKAETGGTVVQSDGAVITLLPNTAAIGVLSKESTPVLGETWSHLSLDGVNPDVVDGDDLNSSLGKYDLWVEQTFQQRNTTVCNGGTHVGADAHVPGDPKSLPVQATCHTGETTVLAPSGNLATFLTTFLARAGDPALVGPLRGVAALPNTDPALSTAGYVMKGSRLGNTCAATKLYW